MSHNKQLPRLEKPKRRDVFGEIDARQEAPRRGRRKLYDDESGEDRETDMDYGEDGQARPGTGVTTTWLALEFGMSQRTVRVKLMGLRPLRYVRANTPIYSVKEASERLVEGVVDVSKQMKNMRPQDMPAMLQAVFWDGQNKRADFMKKSGMLWHTEDVVEVLSDMFKNMRSTMQLWVDTLDRVGKLTPEQMLYMREQVDGLQDELYRKLKDTALAKKTKPMSESPLEPVEREQTNAV